MNLHFCHPRYFDITKCKTTSGVNDLLSSDKNDQPLKSTTLQWYVEHISIFRARDSERVAKLFSGFHANCREKFSEAANYGISRKCEPVASPRAQFLKEAEKLPL